MTLSAAERSSVMRAAMQRRMPLDALRLGVLPLRAKVYDWRRSLRHRFMQAEKASAPETIVADNSLDAESFGRKAQSLFQVELPLASDTKTFRAAGAKRVAWISGRAGLREKEDLAAWHRLYWVLERPDQETFGRLEEWLDAEHESAAYHPYTVSERIRTLAELVGMRTTRVDRELWRKIGARLRADAGWLSSNVETGLGVHNHLLNNARALCAAAHLLEDDDPRAVGWLELGRSLWDELWPRLVLDDGVFSEQSSHYHVLLTRTLLEYVRDARRANRALPPGMIEKATAMCAVTNVLVRPDGTLPLFGDISPDVPTLWLRGISRACARGGLLGDPLRAQMSGYAAGASAFFLEEAGSSAPGEASREGRWVSRLFPQGGVLFVRQNTSDLELVAHGDPRPRSEGHGDAGRGSFEIWCGGRRIVVDGGVPTYEPGAMRQHFRGEYGQNTVSVDGLAPAVLAHEAALLPNWYQSLIRGGSWQSDETRATFTWYGFERLRPGLVWKRTWSWKEARLVIEDQFTGWTGVAHVRASVHFGETGWSSPARGIFTHGGACSLQVSGASDLKSSLIDLPHATDYGVVNEGQGICVEGRAKIPALITWSFDFGELNNKCAELLAS